MKLLLLSISLVALVCRHAYAQASIETQIPSHTLAAENVTVTGERMRDEQIRSFVKSRALPTFQTGKIARWEVNACPVAVGLRPEATRFITQRVKDIAAKVGAPVNIEAPCKPNIEIVFTTDPQSLLDGILKDHQFYLGYHDNSQQATELAKVSHPIQSWYATQTVDVNDITKLDSGAPGLKTGSRLTFFSNSDGTGKLADGHRSTMYHVFIVVNPQQLGNYEIGSLADYIAFLALAQPGSLDDCTPLPSILNLLARGCSGATQTTTISNDDIGYLRGIYRMAGGSNLNGQQNEIAYQMKVPEGARSAP
jgi:hypothetical protein